MTASHIGLQLFELLLRAKHVDVVDVPVDHSSTHAKVLLSCRSNILRLYWAIAFSLKRLSSTLSNVK